MRGHRIFYRKKRRAVGSRRKERSIVGSSGGKGRGIV